MLQIEGDGSVLRLTLNRPEVRNAFNDELIAALSHAVADLPTGTRAVVVSGNGPGFCAGGDLEWMRKAAGYTEEENTRDAMRLARLFKAMADCPVPVITKVHGAAFGGGCGLVAASDIAVSADDAKFAFSEVKLGLIPSTISPFVISKIGRGNARALFTTGEPFDAQTALRIGLIHEVGNIADLDGIVDRKLKHILSSGPEAIRQAKKLIMDGEIGLDECAKRLARIRASKEGKEGVAAFLDKRKATFVVDRETAKSS